MIRTNHVKAFAVLAVLLTAMTMTGCKAETKSHSKTAIIAMPNGDTVQGEVETYASYSYGVCVVRINGVEYKTHMANVVIITDREDADAG